MSQPSQSNNTPPKHPWTKSTDSVLEALGVSPDGLSANEVESRREKFGRNKLKESKSRSNWDILVAQFQSLVVLILVAAGIGSFALGEWIDGIAISVAVIINAVIGYFMEVKAVRSMESLKEMSNVRTKVRREGQIKEIPAQDLVIGDVVVLESGDIISADLRLLEAAKMRVNESALTGESVPVSKAIDPLDDPETPLAERQSMAFKGTSVTRGTGEGVVVAVGQETELGQISTLVEEAEDETTPLEKRLDKMGQKLVWVTLAVVVGVAIIGILRGEETMIMVETAVALAVAAIPEGLPIVATVTLARGMYLMAERNALVNQLAAVETLGSTSIICTDKTGTLTENQMTITRILLPEQDIAVSGEGLETEGQFSLSQSDNSQANGHTSEQSDLLKPEENPVLDQILKVGVMCNNAALSQDKRGGEDVVGEPMEIALLVAGQKAGYTRHNLLEKQPEVREEAFDPDLKMMATIHEENGHYRVAVKGAPHAVLEACTNLAETENGTAPLDDSGREHWEKENERLAEEGLRVIALATKTVDDSEADPYTDLTFLGMVGLVDPPREEVKSAIEACHKAGINVVMVTGDQPITAKNVGQAVGLFNFKPNAQGSQNGTQAHSESENGVILHGNDLHGLADSSDTDELNEKQRQALTQTQVLARVSPKQKLQLISAHQDKGAIVAMTGDGVNDAPALKKADIGISMGQRGTQVAQDASDMVLQDDAFSSIVVAVEQGRVIFDNIRKFMIFLLSGNASQIIAVSLASIIGVPLPILPLQILLLNVVIDVFPGLALGMSKGDSHIMNRPPRDPQESILATRHWAKIGGYGLIIALTALGALGIAMTWLGLSGNAAVSISFLTLAFARLWHVLNMRDFDMPLIKNAVTQNRFVWGAIGLCIGLLLLTVYVPGVSDVLKVVAPDALGWSVILAMSLIPLVVVQSIKQIYAQISGPPTAAS